jgi:hypothetical protein
MSFLYQEYYNQVGAIIEKNCHKRNFKNHKQSKKLANVSGFRVKPK